MLEPADQKDWNKALAEVKSESRGADVGTPHIEYPLRLYLPTDSGLVIKTWMDHCRSMAPFKSMPREAIKAHTHLMEELVARHRPMMICGSEEDSVLVKGWICADTERHVLHFLYVRNAWRQRGIGTALMRVNFPGFRRRPIYHTHPGRSVKHLRQKWMLVHNPYLVESTCASRQ